MVKSVISLLKIFQNKLVVIMSIGVVVLKNFNSFLTLFQVHGSINEMLFLFKFLFLKAISKATNDLVKDVF